MVTVALASVVLDTSLTVSPASSVAAEPPPAKLTVAPAVTAGGAALTSPQEVVANGTTTRGCPPTAPGTLDDPSVVPLIVPRVVPLLLV